MKHITEATVDELLTYVINIASLTTLSWSTKYDYIFRREVSERIRPLISPRHNYYDPDMGYKEDVLAFARVCEKIAKERNAIAQATGLSP